MAEEFYSSQNVQTCSGARWILGGGLVLEGLSGQYVKLTVLNNVAPSLRMGGATSHICGHTDRPTDMTVRYFPRLSESTLISKCASRLIDPTKMCKKIQMSGNFATNSKLRARRSCDQNKFKECFLSLGAEAFVFPKPT